MCGNEPVPIIFCTWVFEITCDTEKNNLPTSQYKKKGHFEAGTRVGASLKTDDFCYTEGEKN